MGSPRSDPFATWLSRRRKVPRSGVIRMMGVITPAVFVSVVTTSLVSPLEMKISVISYRLRRRR